MGINTGKFFTVLLVGFLLFFGLSCLNLPSHSTDTKEANRERNQLFLLNLINSIPDPNQKLYRFLPVFRNEIRNEQFLEFFSIDSSKPKIIFIHGWNPNERSSQNTTTNSEKITNILSTFQNGIVHFQLNRASASSEFDLYLYTYRTSNSVAYNGDQFFNSLMQNFSVGDRIYIVAHSMGGLVTRSVIKNQNYPTGLIDGVITLGTPMFGSPFATKNYLASAPLLADLIGFLTETEGGGNLSHWNGGQNQPSIPSSQNDFLSKLESGFPSSPRFISFFGNLNSNCQPSLFAFYKIGCEILTANSPTFPENDGVVPKNSAIRGGNVFASIEFSGFDHSMIAFQANSLDDANSIRLFERVIQSLASFKD